MDPKKLKEHIFRIIQLGNKEDVASRVFDYVISVLIISVIGITFALTFDISENVRRILGTAELAITCVFIAEYALRLWTSDLLYPRGNHILRFIFSFYGIIDLLTIIAFFIPEYSGIVALRLIRVMRILRLFRINQSTDAFNVIAVVLRRKKNQLLSSMTIVLILILTASLSMYSFEHEAQPDVFTNGFSGIWWAVSAILTVGYGDIYPITLGGEILAIIISLLGVCAVAVPTGIISAGFVEYYTRVDANKRLDTALLEKARKMNVDVNKLLKEYLDSLNSD